MEAQNTKFCQSCSMPMNDPEAKYGTEKDGSLSADYCNYCYRDGQFLADQTMEQMVDSCVPFVRDHFGGDEAAKAAMMEIFPKLKRWAN